MPDRLQIVIGCDQGVGGYRVRHARGVRQAQRSHARTGLHQQHVGMTVVVALELNNLVATGEGTRQPQGTHRGLRPGVYKTDHLQVRHELFYQRRQLHFQGTGGTETGASGGSAVQGCHHLRLRVTQDQGTPGKHVVDVAIAVNIVNKSAFAVVDKERLPANRAKCPHRRTDTARHHLLRFLIEFN